MSPGSSAASLPVVTIDGGGAIANLGTVSAAYDRVNGNTAVEGSGIWNAGWLSLSGEEVMFNHLQAGPGYVTPAGSGLYNAGGSVGLYGDTIAYNYNVDWSFGGDTYGV